ncbi:hypothetical protein PRNP1_003824 [Phytophthora ramorum]|uniref:uncharacterized protein n=1 Tax=Phytophthora ramorum TaxID=164328 RepID=UPI0030A7CA1E|nr:hypothetical protein KRP23_3482 [Phytophthora ramorum]
MTDAALRARRRDNAKLMETNLSLLMDIREVNNEIDEMRQKLGVQYASLSKRGVAIPKNVSELLKATGPAATSEPQAITQ